jgi:hypothetical protein
MLITESPDIMRIKELSLEYDDSNTTTFCVLPNRTILYSDSRTHTFIFNAIRKIDEEPKNYKKILNDYDIKLKGEPLNFPVLHDIAKKLSRDMGKARMQTHAGRFWRNCENKHIGQFHAISFWSKLKEVQHSGVLPLIVNLFKLDRKVVYFETINTSQPLIYADKYDGLDEVRLKSKIDPTLTEKSIIDILVRMHVDPDSLTPKEREIAFEFRGHYKNMIKKGGYENRVQQNYFSRFSENIKNHRRELCLN